MSEDATTIEQKVEFLYKQAAVVKSTAGVNDQTPLVAAAIYEVGAVLLERLGRIEKAIDGVAMSTGP